MGAGVYAMAVYGIALTNLAFIASAVLFARCYHHHSRGSSCGFDQVQVMLTRLLPVQTEP